MAYAQQRRTITERLIAALVKLFTGPGSWRDADAARFVRQAVPLVRAGQVNMASLAAAQVAADAGLSAPIPLARNAVTDLRGVDPAEVYRRPFVTLRTALAEDKSLTEAVELATTRLREVAEGDLQLAHSHAAREAMRSMPAEQQPRFWRRVLMGEESCALCIVAASHRYTIEDLNPIHPGCDCEVRAVFGRDETRAADDARLERVHAAVAELTGRADAGGRRIDYRQLIISEHGELGPMLARPRDRFTSADEIGPRTT